MIAKGACQFEQIPKSVFGGVADGQQFVDKESQSC